jgi:hypothetical protein
MFSDGSYLAFHNPLDGPLHFAGLELLVMASFALTLRHAIERYRSGEKHHLLQWLTACCYGVIMELIAFNYINSYDHGQFTVQLYHRKLPLYVVFLYPVFHYTGLELAQRWKLKAIPEALIAGLAMCLIDIPFDVVGVNAKWWSWLSGDPNFKVRWLGVPLTSYYWYLTFGAAYALLCRLSRNFVNRKGTVALLWLSPLLGIGVVVVGTIFFQPFHGLVALGVPTEAVLAAHIAICVGLAIWLRPRAIAPSVATLSTIPIVLAAWHMAVLSILSLRGRVAQPGISMAISIFATLILLFLIKPPLRKSAVAPLVTSEIAGSR